MKRLNILIPGTLVCALIFVCALVGWHASQPSFADEKQNAKPVYWKHVTFKSERGKEEDVLVLEVWKSAAGEDRKSTRLNSSHQIISYAVFCLKKKII